MALHRRASASKQCFDAGDDGQLEERNAPTTMAKMWKKLKEEYHLLEYHACPEYLKDNEFILSYYRANFSISQALSSLFKLHNETLNIWTQAFTGVSTVPRLDNIHRLRTWTPTEIFQQSMKEDVTDMMAPVLNRTTRWPFFVFMGGAMFCLLASAVCHLFTCHSQSLAVLLMRIDYAGIATMIATSFFPPIYYVFQCAPMWQWIYLSAISIMGIITLGVLFAPSLQSGKYRPFRALMFMSMGVVGLIPAIHGVMMNWNKPLCPLTVVHEGVMAGCYVVGAIIYVTRIPERWKPGVFDLGGHSHSVFHILVIAGAYAHYQAALLFLEWRDSKGCSSWTHSLTNWSY